VSPRRHAAAREVQGGATPRSGASKGEGATNPSKGRRRSPKRISATSRPLTWAEAYAEATTTGWHFVLPVPERVNAIWRRWDGRTLVSKKHRADKATAPRSFARIMPLDGDVAVRLVWVRAKRQGDVDGRIKATLDLLKGIAYHDDAQVAELHIIRVDDGSPARMEVFVWPADQPALVTTKPEKKTGGRGDGHQSHAA